MRSCSVPNKSRFICAAGMHGMLCIFLPYISNVICSHLITINNCHHSRRDMTDSEVSSPESEAGSDGKTRQTPSTSAGVGRRKLFESALSDKTNVSAQDLILKEVRKTNSTLAGFSTRMDAMENRLKSVEEQQKDMTTPSSSVDSSTERVKRKVPTRIRVSALELSRSHKYYIIYHILS